MFVICYWGLQPSNYIILFDTDVEDSLRTCNLSVASSSYVFESSGVLRRCQYTSVIHLPPARPTVSSSTRSSTTRQLYPPTTSTCCHCQPCRDPEDHTPDVEVTVGLAGDVSCVDGELAEAQRRLAVLAVDGRRHSPPHINRISTIPVAVW